MPTTQPKTYADVLVLARAAQMLSWHRSSNTLTLTIDDMAADRRSCIDIRIQSGKAGIVEGRTLSGYDSVKKRWSQYCSPTYTVCLPHRRGQKELQAYIAELATHETGWANPEAFSHYRRAEVAA